MHHRVRLPSKIDHFPKGLRQLISFDEAANDAQRMDGEATVKAKSPPSGVGMERCLGLRRCRSGIHVMGTTSWIAIIELGAASASRFSKSRKALAKEWSPSTRLVEILAPQHDSRALKESIARRTRKGRIWPAFLD